MPEIMKNHSDVETRSLATNKVLRDTYRLLSMTLVFAGAVAYAAMTFNWPHPIHLVGAATGMPMLGLIVIIGMWMGLLVMIEKNKNSTSAIGWVFAFAGFTGYMAGAMINMYLAALPNGYQVVSSAFMATGAIFLGTSFYVRYTQKDFSGMGKWLFIGILGTFVMAIMAFAFNLSGFSLVVSGAFVALMTGLILWQTSEIIHGRETNYISATVTLYVAIYNLFTSLLHLLGVFSGGDD